MFILSTMFVNNSLELNNSIHFLIEDRSQDLMGTNEYMYDEYDNYTEDDTFQSDYYDVQFRATQLLSQPDQIIALILGFIAIVLNVLTLTALTKTRGRLTTHFRFMVSLAVSDMFIGLTVIAHVVNIVVNPNYPPGYGTDMDRLRSRCAPLVIKAMNNGGLNICLLNLMGMAIDHFIAITQPLHYPQLLNKKRSTTLIIGLWIIALLCGFSDFYTALYVYNKWKHKYNYCEVVEITPYTEEYTVFATAGVAAVVMIYVYVKIYSAVRSHKIPGEQSNFDSLNKNSSNSYQSQGSVKRRVRRSNRALKTTLLIVVTFVLCWLPLCLFQVGLIIQVRVDAYKLREPHIQRALTLMDKYLVDLLLLNTIADPVIYTVRLAEVQLGYKRLFQSMIKCNTIRKLLRLQPHRSRQFNYRDNIFRDDTVMTNKAKTTTKQAALPESKPSQASSCKCSQASSSKGSNKCAQELYL